MSFSLFSEDGFVDALGSATDYWNVIKEVEKHRTSGPLYRFIRAGKTTNPQGVVKDITKLLPQVKNKDLYGMLEALKEGLEACKKIAIVDI